MLATRAESDAESDAERDAENDAEKTFFKKQVVRECVLSSTGEATLKRMLKLLTAKQGVLQDKNKKLGSRIEARTCLVGFVLCTRFLWSMSGDVLQRVVT